MNKVPPQVSVVVGTYNRASSLQRTLDSFAGLTLEPDFRWELIVVDNNSTDGTKSVVEDFSRIAKFPVRYVFEGRQGRSNALNCGIENATGDIIAFTDDDVILDADWLRSLKLGFDEFGCAAIAGRVLPMWTSPQPDWLEMEEQQAIVHFDLGTEPQEIHHPPLGANSAFRRSVFGRYGNFRPDLGVSGGDENRGITCDDTEFGLRLINAREKIIYMPTALVHHPVEPHRPTKTYFLKWFYNDGRSGIRTFGWPDNTACLFRIPRWLYRGVLANFLQWMFTFDSKRRFHHKLRTYRALGRIVEAHRLANKPAVRGKEAFAGLSRPGP